MLLPRSTTVLWVTVLVSPGGMCSAENGGFGTSITYLLPAELLRSVHELGHNAVALGFELVGSDSNGGIGRTEAVSRMTSLIRSEWSRARASSNLDEQYHLLTGPD